MDQQRTAFEQCNVDDGEIDLFELVSRLIKERLTIIAVFIAVVFLAGVYVFFAPKTYEVKVSFLPPFSKNVVGLNFPTVVDLNEKKVYGLFAESLSAPNMGSLLLEQAEIKSLFLEKEVAVDVAVAELMRSYTVELPTESKTKFLTGDSFLISLNVQRDSAEDALTLANSLIALTVSRVKNDLIGDLLLGVDEQLKVNEKQYALVDDKIDKELAAEVQRLRETDTEQKARILEQMSLLREKAKQQRYYQIERLQAELALAEKLGIKRPIDPLAFKKEQHPETTIDLSSRSPSRYWLGTEILSAEIKTLQDRKNDDPYIEEMAELQKQLKSLEVNHRINTILAREDNQFFSEELRALTTRRGILLQARERLQSAQFEVARVVQAPILSTKAIKPKKAMILALGGVAGLMLGVVIVLVRQAIITRRQSQTT